MIHQSVGRERARKTVENRLSLLRRKLGVGTDGRDLLPEAQPGAYGSSCYIVSGLVLTDVDLLTHRLHHCQGLEPEEAAPILLAGLGDIGGPLFASRCGYDFWPVSEGVLAEMTAVVMEYGRACGRAAAELRLFTDVARTEQTVARALQADT